MSGDLLREAVVSLRDGEGDELRAEQAVLHEAAQRRDLLPHGGQHGEGTGTVARGLEDQGLREEQEVDAVEVQARGQRLVTGRERAAGGLDVAAPQRHERDDRLIDHVMRGGAALDGQGRAGLDLGEGVVPAPREELQRPGAGVQLHQHADLATQFGAAAHPRPGPQRLVETIRRRGSCPPRHPDEEPAPRDPLRVQDPAASAGVRERFFAAAGCTGGQRERLVGDARQRRAGNLTRGRGEGALRLLGDLAGRSP